MAILHLVRHGRCVEQGMIRGRLPGYPLSDVGKEELKVTAEFLANRNIVAVYSSPVQRAVQTAEVIAKPHGLKVKMADEINEWLNPKWWGKYWSQIPIKEILMYIFKPAALNLHGENIFEVGERVARFCREVATEKGEVVCVSHRDVILVGKFTLMGKNLDRYNFSRCRTASVTTLEKKNGKWKQKEYFVP